MVTTKVKGINLLPKEYIIAQRVVFYQKVISAVVALEVVCFIVFVALPPKREVKVTQDRLLYLQSQVNSDRYAGVNKTLNDLETAKADIQKWMTEYQNIKMDGYISGSLLDQLVSRIPSGVTINKLSVADSETGEDGSSKKTITIQGSSDEFEEAVSYLSVLETVFSPGVIDHSITQGEKDKYAYTFTITETMVTASAQTDTEAASEVAEADDQSAEEGVN